MLEIPLPPQPQLNAATAITACGAAIVLGVVLLMWGQRMARPVMMLACAVGGYAVGASFLWQLGIEPVVGGFVLLGVGAIIGFVLSGVLWGGLLAAMLALAGAAVLIARLPVQSVQGAASYQEYLPQFGQSVAQVWTELWRTQSVPLIVVLAAALAFPLGLSLAKPRGIRVLATTLTGAIVAVIAMVVAVGASRPAVWSNVWEHWYIPAGLAGLLVVLGGIWQYRSGKKPAEPPADKDKPKSDSKPADAKK